MANGKQIAALKYILFKSLEQGNLFKQVVSTLLDHSKGLTRSVAIKLEANKGYDRKELRQLYRDCSVATSCGCRTHINELVAITGSDLRFSYTEDDTGCQLGFWTRRGMRKPRNIEVSRSKLQKVDLSKPGLYPSLEKDELLKRAS
jgi:hypothetical protein